VEKNGFPGLWDQLNTTTLGGTTAATAAEIVSQTDPIHIQAENIAAIQSANIINEGAMRDGKPIPGTSVAKTVRLTDNSRTTLFTPNAGEVWQLISASSDGTGTIAGSITYYLYYLTTDQDDAARLVLVGTDATSSTDPNLEALFEKKTAQFVDENCTVQVKVDAMQDLTSIDISIYAIRVR